MPRNELDDSRMLGGSFSGWLRPEPSNDRRGTRQPSRGISAEDAAWLAFADAASRFDQIASRRDEFDQLPSGAAHFSKLLEPIQALFETAKKLIRKGRQSQYSWDRDASQHLDEGLRRIALSLLGGWFWDWVAARSVFLVELRTLLTKHKGQYALIGRDRKTRKWQVMEVVASKAEAFRRAARHGLSPRDVYVYHIVEGAENTPLLDVSRPETL